GPTGYHPLIRKQWAAFGPPKEAAYQITDSKLRANFSDQHSSQHSIMQRRRRLMFQTRQGCYEQLTERFERCLLKISPHSRHLGALRSSDLRNLSHPRDPDKFTSIAKAQIGRSYSKEIRRQMNETNCRVDATRICSSRERPPTRWTNVFVKRINQLYSYLHSHQVYSYQPIFYRSRYETRASGHARMKPPPWATVARTRDEWNMCRRVYTILI
ncbi:hypothetical protein KIN20_010892, partial [Parelaphostrongylus tenuis]